MRGTETIPVESLTLFLPARDEEGSIARVVAEAIAAAEGCARRFEILVVDDGSADGTAAAVEEIARRDPRVRHVRHATSRGYGAALRTGFREARHGITAYCDADGQFDLRDLPAMLEPLARGEADIVAGRRTPRRDPLPRRILGRCWSGFVRGLLGIEAADVNCGFKALRTDVARALDLGADGAFVSAEMLGKAAAAGIRVAEVPVRHLPRVGGAATGARPGVILRALGEILVHAPRVAFHRPANSVATAAPWTRFLPAPRPLAWMLTALLAVGYGTLAYLTVERDKPLDFHLYRLAARALVGGEDIYSLGDADWARLAAAEGVTNCAPPYRYPPLTALAVTGLLPLSPSAAAGAWALLTGAAFIASAWALGCVFRGRYGTALALCALGAFVPPLSTVYAGQVNGFVLLALSLALRGILRGRPWAAGAALAAGAHVKILPLAQIAWLGWSRRWRPFATGIAATLLVGVATAAWAGPACWASFARNLPRLGEMGNLIPHTPNQSLDGFLSRVLLPHDPGGGMVRVAWMATVALLVIATTILCLPRRSSPRTAALEFGLVTTATCLVTPYAWYHQFALLLVPGVVLLDRAIADPRGRGTLVALAIACAATDLFGTCWRRLEGFPLLHSLPLLSAVLLWGLLARGIREEARATGPLPGAAGPG